jgi:hypothetical protein
MLNGCGFSTVLSGILYPEYPTLNLGCRFEQTAPHIRVDLRQDGETKPIEGSHCYSEQEKYQIR